MALDLSKPVSHWPQRWRDYHARECQRELARVGITTAATGRYQSTNEALRYSDIIDRAIDVSRSVANRIRHQRQMQEQRA